MDFRVYIKDDREYFIYGTNGSEPIKKDSPFAESLLDFAYLDVAACEDLFFAAEGALGKDTTALNSALDKLAGKHLYFELPRLLWQEQGVALEELQRVGHSIERWQDQIKVLLGLVLDADIPEKPAQERMVAYERRFRQSGTPQRDYFTFGPQPLAFELVDEDTFTYALHPQTIEDLIAFFLAQAVEREQRFRICKSCGRYFALTGYRNTEYCDRVYDELGRTCKQIGAISRWQREKKDDPIFVAYSREYKKRFARTRSGKVSKEDFFAWSEQARKLRGSCIAKEISLEEFRELLSR